MTAKEYLSNYRILMMERENLRDELHSIIEDIATSNGAISYDKDKVQTSPSNDMMYRMHERIEKRSRYIDRRLDYIERVTNEIKDSINSMQHASYKRFLNLVYIQNFSVEDATVDCNYSKENAGRIHNAALNSFTDRVLKNMTCDDL